MRLSSNFSKALTIAILICPLNVTSETRIEGDYIFNSDSFQRTSDCIRIIEVEAILSQLKQLSSDFQTANQVVSAVNLIDPLGNGGMQSFGQPVNSLVDINLGGGILDYNCGVATYDGHRGTDIEIRDFYDMDEGISVICVNSGVVTQAVDGLFDRNVYSPPESGNNVGILSFDGTWALYYHLKSGSIRVSVGDTVLVGDTIAEVGSSGSSYWPHLHLEFWSGGTWHDPMQGSCNTSILQFQIQPQYLYSLPFEVISDGVTHLPITRELVAERPPSISHHTLPGNVTSWIRGSSLLAGDKFHWAFYRNGTLWDSLTVTPSSPRRTGWWSVTKFISDQPQDIGSWEIRVYHNSDLVASQFFMADESPNLAPSVAAQELDVTYETEITGELSGIDSDGTIFWFNVQSVPKHGSFSLFGGRKRKYRYLPDTAFRGVDTVTIYATDDHSLNSASSDLIFTVGSECCQDSKGDLNGDNVNSNILDLTYLVDFIFRGGSEPSCPFEADLNSDGSSGNIIDLTYLVDFIFRGGSAAGPC